MTSRGINYQKIQQFDFRMQDVDTRKQKIEKEQNLGPKLDPFCKHEFIGPLLLEVQKNEYSKA